MAGVFIADPSLLSPLLPLPSARRSFSLPERNLRLYRNPSLLPASSPCVPPCSCAAGTLDPEPSEEIDNTSLSTRLEGGKDRRRAVRIAWEKLVRWSRSWRSKAKTDVLERTKKVAVLGGGSFGTAMAAHVASRKAGMEVSMLLRDSDVCRAINETHFNFKYFPEHKLPENIMATTSAKDALLGADFCLHAVPVQMLDSHVCIIFIPEAKSFLMTFGVAAMVAASKDKKLARAAQQLLASPNLRISSSRDVTGVEIAGALKNVLAIASGIVEGMNLGNNCMAALVAQGCSEIRWLATKMGAKPTTLTGLSGSGDIMLTCFVNLSRNRTVGVRLGSGEKLDDILGSMNQVAEGVSTAGAVIALAEKYHVKMPVLTAVARIIDNELTPRKAVLELMSLPQVEEV
ncbi:glycerol-3-phosphate dehydrogenase [NAD(+)], chloroplastic-like isoform X2 [Zingiber officinale]|uniref:glycerol-3-phosphate dehydrogenase [NAD(+)], chloroplastic-like isoform X2 n=1 Tax=Zingiber officinale TaxID=94328 RepID=UPI001C4D7D34|nr:glycerol-3-phosphate dehydrogenase [NAD(+)], chloroplastic-like isoform X2 [Zingiber officinale]